MIGYFVTKVGITLVNTPDDFAVVSGYAVLILYILLPAGVLLSVIKSNDEQVDQSTSIDL
jgi:hypothetical protein